jgi:nickel-dependent lactate racemase
VSRQKKVQKATADNAKSVGIYLYQLVKGGFAAGNSGYKTWQATCKIKHYFIKFALSVIKSGFNKCHVFLAAKRYT